MAFTEKLRSQFNISEEENNEFDAEFERRIINEFNRNLVVNNNIIDTNNLPLNGDNAKITLNEFNEILRKTKEKSPGFSKITKSYIVNLPNSIKNYLIYLYNCSISLGYMPARF